MGEKETQGSGETPQGVRILVLLPAGDKNIGDAEKEWDNSGAAKCFNAQVDFLTVKTGGEKGKCLTIAKSCAVGGKVKKLGDALAPEDIMGNGYCLGIAYGDRLTAWICDNDTLTPKNHPEKAKLPFILITTKSKVDKPHLKAYPSEELVGMLLARLMDWAADCAGPKKVVKGWPEVYEWRAFFYKDKEPQSSNACLEAFVNNAKDFDQRAGEKVFTFGSGEDGKEQLKRCSEDCSKVKLFCVYAASAPDATAYNTVVKAIDELSGKTNDTKILVTDACWDVPKECANLQIAQLCGTQSQTAKGKLLVGQKLFCWLIPVLLELALKIVKWCRGIKATESGGEKSIADLITEFGPLMAVQETTFSFIKREMFIPFSYSFREASEAKKAKYAPTENMRLLEEAHEAVAVALSRIQTAADKFKKERTGAKPESLKTETKSDSPETEAKPKTLKEATTEFAEAFEKNVLKPCFAAREVFFVDDKHGWAFPFKMPENCVREVAEHSRVIQVAYRRNDENTEAVQLYRIREKVAVPITDSLLKWLCNIGSEELLSFYYGKDDKERRASFSQDGFSSETMIICSRSQQRAEEKSGKRNAVWDLDKDVILDRLIMANLEKPDRNKPVGRYRYNYLYYIPVYNWDGSGSTPAVAFFSDVKFCDFELSALKMVVTRFYSVLYTEDRVRKVKLSAVRAAIGAIMSRNGSHNIGSHVLASLSHNVGTMPDDRVLYQYIQHRMDYIATATTDAPRWTQPTMFVASMMKEFLRQKHLLEHISGSEGLHAYKFQGHSAGGDQENTIRVHVRRINPTEQELKDGEWEKRGFLDKGSECVTEFIRYPNEKDGEARVDISQDIAVAISGGVIGQHAFYTILENVLRNAAKHEWSQIDSARRKHLDLYVDFVDRPDKGSVACRVWTKCVWTKEAPAGEDQNKNDQVKQPPSADDKLLGNMRNKIGSSFVDTAGELRKENWGIAEMRISAGYLRGSDMADVAGLSSPVSALKIIRPVLVETECEQKCLGYCFEIGKPKELLVVLKDETARKIGQTLGLGETNKKVGKSKITVNSKLSKNAASAFAVSEKSMTGGGGNDSVAGNAEQSKPRGKSSESTAYILKRVDRETEQMIDGSSISCEPYKNVAITSANPGQFIKVQSESEGGAATELNEAHNVVLTQANANALQYGVEFRAASEVGGAEANSYSYVLFEDSDLKQELLPFVPFRVLTQGDGYEGDFFDAKTLVEKVGKIVGSKAYAQETCFQLLEDVYAGWLKHLRKVRYGGKVKYPLQLAIDIEGETSSSGGRQSLVSDHDLIRFVFEHSFGAAVRSFLSDEKNSAGISDECMALLCAVAGMRQRRVASYKELATYCGKEEVEVTTKAEADEIVKLQLGLWFSAILNEGRGELNLQAMPPVPDDLVRLKSLCKREHVLKIGTLREFYGRAGNYAAVVRFAMFIVSTILKQAESFLRKYEEEISTMPQGFSAKPDDGKKPLPPKWEKVGVSIGFVNDDIKRAKCKGDGVFCYFRHGEQTFETFTAGYYEALSGAQSGLNALVSYRHDVQCAANSSKPRDLKVELAENSAARFTARLAENAIVRLLIIDERVKKFMDDHDNVRRMLPGLGIAVLDHTSQATKEMFPKGEDAKWESIGAVPTDDKKLVDKEPLPMTLSDFEVVIIHQGVIDKLLDEHESKEAVRKWLEKMNKSLAGHYIVITTGRGSPANIPENARVLPYSVIESSILQRYPEKTILVDTLMNLLPTGRRS